MRRARLLLSLIVLAGLLCGLLPGALGAQGPTPNEPDDGPVVVRLYYRDRAGLAAVAARLDIWEAHHDLGYVVAAVGPEQYRWLQSLGYPLEIDAELTALLSQRNEPLPGQGPDTIPGYPCYRTVEETHADMQALADNYPTLAELYDFGDSWDKLNDPPGYDIYALRITNEDIPGPKPTFFLMAEIHAREYTTAETAMRFAEYLIQNYGSDPETTFFVDYHNIYVVPMDNPDGRKFAEQGYYWRKNTHYTPGCAWPPTSYDHYGVDLNRNSSFKWGDAGIDPCEQTYQGTSAASEPETQYLQNYILTLFPDQRGPGDGDPAPDDATGILITLHSYQGLVLWPWGWTYDPAPNAAQLQTIGTKLATYNGYTPHQSVYLYPTTGTTDDWSYGELGIASFTFELGYWDFFEPCSHFENETWPGNRDSLLYAWKIAETPYMTAYGPDTLNAAATPAGVAPGTPVQLTATVSDQQNGNQQVQAAEYYLLPLHSATPPGDPGTGTAMSPADGSWNSAVEGVVATVDTSALAPGGYLLAVRGRDAGNHWGPLEAAFLYIVQPGVSPVIEGTVLSAATGGPLQANVAAGVFHTTSDPASGYYSMTVVSGTYDMVAGATGYATTTVSGIVAQNYQTVMQDFTLYPVCDIFSDDVESGNQGWTAQTPWAITTEASHSPSHSWTDSPGGDYGNNVNTSLTSSVLDLTDYEGVTLSFWHTYETEAGYDYCYVEYSTDGGGTWTTAASYDGQQTQWGHETLDLAALDGQTQARLRFRLDSDYYQTDDGWHLDDFVLSGGGPGCGPLAPIAGFSSNSPVQLGSPVVFTNQTSGTEPITYLWSFGDGMTDTVENPTHLYGWAGTFTVTLTATNSVSSDSVSHPVVVEPVPCCGLTGVTIAGPTSGYPGLYTFTTSYAPPTATLPVDFLWDNGDIVSTTVRTLDVGLHTLTVTATNCTDTVVLDTHTIVIAPTPVCTDVSAVDLTQVTTGTIYPGMPVQFSADIAPDDASKPYSYTVSIDGTPGPVQGSSADPLPLTHTFILTGSHAVELAAWNCTMTVPLTDAVAVLVEEPTQCVSLTAVTIAGATSGPPGTYTFTTSYEPAWATPPIAYLWDNGDTGSTSARLLSAGSYTLTVTATNCTDTVVLDTHTIVISSPAERFHIFLPLVSVRS